MKCLGRMAPSSWVGPGQHLPAGICWSRRVRNTFPRVSGRGLLVVGAVGYGGYLLFTGGASWQEFSSSENGFVVQVPAVPTPGKTNDPKMGVELREFVAKRPSASYTVQVADLREKPINDWLFLAWQ